MSTDDRQTMAVSGATGMVGSKLVQELQKAGHSVKRIVRLAAQGTDEIALFDEATESAANAEGLNVVIHLAGENIAGRRWSAKQKELIRSSRVNLTRHLCESLSKLKSPPKTLICASAIGYYGDRGNETLTEESPGGTGFLADVCREWESATEPARAAGIRVVNLRIGVVLAREGGALAKMLTPFKFGLGGRVGPGTQYWSWITLPDLVRVIQFTISTPTLSGPVNAVSPQPLTNLEFTKVLGQALHRPTIFPLPSFMARLMLGEMAQDLLLASIRVVPNKLQSARFKFQHGDLATGLNGVLKM